MDGVSADHLSTLAVANDGIQNANNQALRNLQDSKHRCASLHTRDVVAADVLIGSLIGSAASGGGYNSCELKFSATLVSEMPEAGENHRHVAFVSRGDDFLVAH
jgi:hypothetical protein